MQKGDVTPYLERLHGYDHKLSKKFVKGWKETNVSIYGKKVELMEELIFDIFGMPMDDKKVLRDRKSLEEAMRKFPKGKEGKSLVCPSQIMVLKRAPSNPFRFLSLRYLCSIIP